MKISSLKNAEVRAAIIQFFPKGNTKKRFQICEKLTVKTPERHHLLVKVSLLLTLNMLNTLFSSAFTEFC